MVAVKKQNHLDFKLKKCPTGIRGFDEVLKGGLPQNRPTIICGNAGSGKTILAMEFLVRGALVNDEPGVFLTFEETYEELITNMDSIHFDLRSLIKKNKIYIECLKIDNSEVIETGKYNLEGLFVRLENAIKKVDAKRVVLDSLDALFFGVNNVVLRTEIHRLFQWLKNNSLTSVITAEFDNGMTANTQLESYLADCVVSLDNRITNQMSTRRLRILKMRGSAHGINEYPFIIDKAGISVLPLISELKNNPLSSHRISTGIKDLDGMLDGKGYFEGSSILISGSAGTGKTSLAVALIKSACSLNKRALYCAFEESTLQIIRNMRSVNLDIEPYLKSGLLRFYTSRPTIQNLELHLLSIKNQIKEHRPEIIILDPVTNLMSEGINSEIRQMLANFVDFLKGQNVTTLFTAAITLETIKSNPSDEGISAMVDTWILVRDIEQNSERNRGIYVLKSRGMNHSAQVREFLISSEGIAFVPIYIGPNGILVGSARLEQTLEQQGLDEIHETRVRNENNAIKRKHKLMDDNIILMKSRYESEIDNLNQVSMSNELIEDILKRSKQELLAFRNKSQGSSLK